MGFELLREADMILDACGRPTPPAGYRFVDLPRIIGWSTMQSGGAEGGSASIRYPYAHRIQNTGNTLFLVRGISTNNALSFRVKWPNGRYFNQTAGLNGGFLNGFGSNQFAIGEDMPVAQGERITVEVQDSANGGTLQVLFWGVLRYLLKDSTPAPGKSVDRSQSEIGCIVGYPSYARSVPGNGLVTFGPDPVAALQDLPRYWCGPNQNIMAPEFLLGDQQPDTPAGYIDEPYTLFSDPITVDTAGGLNAQSLNNAVLASGVDAVFIRRIRAIATWDADTTGTVVWSLRAPSGFSVTGGDLISSDGSYQWLPLVPPLGLKAGQRLILDVSTVDSSDTNLVTVVFEFEAVKRRKVA